MTLEQLQKIDNKFNCNTCSLIFQGGDEAEKWKAIVRLQNSLGQFECLIYLDKLSNILGGKSHAYATIDDRLQALYEISTL